MARTALRGTPNPRAGGRLPHARLAQRGGRRRPGGLAAAEPNRCGRDRESRRLADDGGRPRVAEHAPLTPLAPRGVTRRPDARPIVDRTDGTDPESVGLALLVVPETLSPPERLAFGEDRPPSGGRVCPRARVGGCRGRPAGSAERKPTRRSTIPALHPAPSADGAGSDRRFAGRYASSSSTTAPRAKRPASDAM